MTTALQKELDKLEEIYRKGIADVAAKARKKFVIPYCDRTGYEFRTGMGGWVFHTGKSSLGPGEIPKRLEGVLQSTVLYHSDDLGSLMDGYTPSNYSR